MSIKCNPVIFIPSPRDIPEFIAATAIIRAPKLWIKYHPQADAYEGAREWFLGQPDFTHLVILPDDLIITQENFDDMKEILNNGNVDVLSGWCQNTIREDDSDTCISYKLPPDPPRAGKYEDYGFISMKDVEKTYGFIKILHSGFALTFISRKIVEKIPFRTDYGCCVDSCFSLDLHANQISQFCYLNVKTTHVKTSPDILQVGKKEKSVYLEM